MLGRVVGNYRVIEKIGEGGMGAVYRAVDEMLDREVALKAIRPELAREPQIVERFRAEAKILARVNHPAIATIYSFFHDGGELFLAMEYVRGRTLRDVLEAGALPWQQAVLLLASALEGIAQAHRAGIVHRDLKPDNLMLTEASSLKVMDFGIARMAGSSHMTRTGLLLGTLRYVAPEQIRGEEVDQRTDIYALGIVLYQLLTGKVPFDGPTDFAILKAQLDDPPPPPKSLVPDLPQWLDDAVLKALEKEPAARFPSVDELRAALLQQGVPAEVKARPAEQFPTMILPPRPTSSGAASPETMETDRARLPAGPPPLPTTATPRAAVTGTSYRPVDAAGWKRGAFAAVLIAAGIAVGILLWVRREPQEQAPAPSPEALLAGAPTQAAAPAPAPAEPEPTPATQDQAASSVVPAAVTAQPPRPTPAPRSQQMPKPAAPPPAEPTVPAPTVSQEPQPTPVEAPRESPQQETPPAAPDLATEAGEPPIEELRRMGGELVASSQRLFDAYEVFLEQKDDSGAEITDDDERLQEELEALLETAERFNKRFKDGFFARTKDRLRKRDQKTEVVNRARELATAAGRVESLMAAVQPGPEVRQVWQEVRQRWKRVAQISGGL